MWASTGNVFKTSIDAPIYALEWIHAIHNQGHGDQVRGGRAVAEGVRKGVADVFLPYPVMVPAMRAGLYIEMKKPTEKPKKSGKGGMKPKQIAFREYSLRVGYEHSVCYGWKEAVDALKTYLGY